MNRTLTKLTLAVLLSTALGVVAEGNIITKQTLTLDGAKKVGDAAAAYAKANGAPGGAIAVVDESGFLLYFVRLDGTFTASANISIGKARTSALFKKSTAEFENIVNKGRFAMTALPPDFTPLQGAVPIMHGDHIIGAIGVSGAKSAAQDEEIAYVGARSLDETNTAQK
jgi:glc operon protein GlcG